MRERFRTLLLLLRVSLSSSWTWKVVAGICIRILIMIGTVYLWNWVFSEQFNTFVFGTKTLGVMKGVSLITTLDITIGLFRQPTN
jgi:hypothetical protein